MMSIHKYAAARKRSRTPARNGQVTVVRADPLVLAAALEFADGDLTRVRIIDRCTRTPDPAAIESIRVHLVNT